MVHGFHFIFSAYGFWLPNDPRGSWSDAVRQLDLLCFGPATKVNTTRSVADRPHDQYHRLAAKQALKYPPVRFTGEQARAVAAGFTQAATERGYHIHALAVLPDHAHMVMARHDGHIDQIAAHLKAKATAQLVKERLHPLAGYDSKGRTPSPWARGHWCPFLPSRKRMRDAIRYVQENPVKAGLPPQHWRVVEPYE